MRRVELRRYGRATDSAPPGVRVSVKPESCLTVGQGLWGRSSWSLRQLEQARALRLRWDKRGLAGAKCRHYQLANYCAALKLKINLSSYLSRQVLLYQRLATIGYTNSLSNIHPIADSMPKGAGHTYTAVTSTSNLCRSNTREQ